MTGARDDDVKGPGRDLDRAMDELLKKILESCRSIEDSDKPGSRKFSDVSKARLAAGLIADTSLPKHEREVLGDLLIAAVTDPKQREIIILIHRFLKFAQLHRPED